MKELSLFLATLFIWISAFAGTWQGLVELPRWFSNPPKSFALLRKYHKVSKTFWTPVNLFSAIWLIIGLVMNWQLFDVRNCLLICLSCYTMTGILSKYYFAPEEDSFSKIPLHSRPTAELIDRTQSWLRWATVRDVLLLGSALFVTTAYFLS